MSQGDNVKIKNEGNSIHTAPNSENSNVVNNLNIETANSMPDKQNVSINRVNNVKSQELISNIRENIVSKATEFLVALPIQNYPVERKVKFLRTKGLTDQEIQVSLQRASTICNINQLPVNYNSNVSGIVQNTFESQNWFKRLIGSIAFTASIVYIGYHLYEKYIKKWLFGLQKSPVEKRLEAVELSLKKCLTLLEDKNKTSEFLIKLADRRSEHDQVRNELKSIKSLLLNRSQFPPAPITTGIPQWQQSKNTKPSEEQKNKVNAIDTMNSLLQSKINEIDNMSSNLKVVQTLNDVIDSNINKDNLTLNNLTSNENTSMSSDQNTLPNNIVIESNGVELSSNN